MISFTHVPSHETNVKDNCPQLGEKTSLRAFYHYKLKESLPSSNTPIKRFLRPIAAHISHSSQSYAPHTSLNQVTNARFLTIESLACKLPQSHPNTHLMIETNTHFLIKSQKCVVPNDQESIINSN